MTDDRTLSQRIGAIRQLISAHASGPVTIVAASKTRSASDINDLFDFGVGDYGENRVQEWQEKREGIREGMRFHMIGQLQSNKAAAIAADVSLVHSLDRPSLAQALDRAGQRREKPIDALIEVSVAGEAQKGGVPPAELDECIRAWQRLPGIRLRGMMVIAPILGGNVAGSVFAQGHALWQPYAQRYEAFDILSMGMSGDLIEALKEGSNMIRVGSALFGQRGTEQKQ